MRVALFQTTATGGAADSSLANFHTKGLSYALRCHGVQVSVIYPSTKEKVQVVNGVEFRGIGARAPVPDGSGHGLGRMRHRLGVEGGGGHFSRMAQRAVDATGADVLHVFGLSEWSKVESLVRWAGQTGRRVSWSDHGGSPSRHPIRKWRMARIFAQACTIATSCQARADMWRVGLSLPVGPDWVVQPETSTEFPFPAQEDARHRTGLRGDPVLVSTSNLVTDKAPLLMLEAFEKILETWPNARLFLYYRNADMLPDVKAHIAQSAALTHGVALMGQAPHRLMPDIYASADIFLLTTRREIGSNSTVEAIACGAIPVTSELPSLSEILGHGSVGGMFSVDATADEIATTTLGRKPDLNRDGRRRMRDYFEQRLSYPRLAERLTASWSRSQES